MTNVQCEKCIQDFVKGWKEGSLSSRAFYIRGDDLEDLILNTGEYPEIELKGVKKTAKLNHVFVFSGLATKNCAMAIYGIYKIWLSI